MGSHRQACERCDRILPFRLADRVILANTGANQVEVVQNHDHRAPLTGLRDHLPEPQPLLGIEADRRLVEDEQVGIAQQGLGQPDPPAHPAAPASLPEQRRYADN